MVLISKSFKIRLYPTIAQRQALLRAAGATRACWNHLLAANQQHYRETKTFLFHKQMSASLPGLKIAMPWLGDATAASLQRVARNLDTALRACFKRGTGFPRFKTKNSETDSFYLTNQRIRFGSKCINLPKIGEVRYRGAIPCGRALSATVKQDGDLWWISVACEVEVPDGQPLDICNVIGIDVGLKEFLTTSDGEVVENPRLGRNSANKLARAQRRMARRAKGGKNRLKARLKVQRIHRQIKNQRKDFLHKLSRDLVNNYDVIITEDLCIKGLARTRLARAIHDASWGEFMRQLSYKALWGGQEPHPHRSL